MPYSTLIATDDLAAHLQAPGWVIVDCRFSLGDPERGRTAYETSHIPGAVYAHLDDDLSGLVEPGRTGRHPLPAVDAFARTLSGWGISDATQVVTYDDAGGTIAARLWWMLQWLGHDAAAVLDGGWPAWTAEHRPVDARLPAPKAATFVPRPRADRLADAESVVRIVASGEGLLLDARGPERYRGEHEPIDPVAGHIPGAVSSPYADNLDPEGRFITRGGLYNRYRRLLAQTPARDVVCYCGSGVTAAHNLLALAHAGLTGARLYAGSWSEWITDPDRPVETGS